MYKYTTTYLILKYNDDSDNDGGISNLNHLMIW